MGNHHRRHVLMLLVGAGALVATGAIVGTTLLLSGALSTNATKQHFRVTHRVLDLGLEYSVRAAADDVPEPALGLPGMRARGAACYREHCVTCHGAPGVAPDSFALGMLPVPGNLAHSAAAHPPEWLYHVTRKGVRMTGMPAWEYRLSDQSLWSVVAFLEMLPVLDVDSYRALMATTVDASCESRVTLPLHTEGADVLLRQYACHSCHQIESVVGPRVDTGPPLIDWSKRAYIAGVLPNTEENLARWIMDPPAISPQTLMPDLGVPPEHARAMAVFLLTPR
jgi:mono/diheme cytochrome c family protein/cytochrome c2